MNQEQKAFGLTIGKCGEETVTCGLCGRILGYIKKEHCESLYLHLFCACGADGYLRLGEIPDNASADAADKTGERICCTKCRSVLFAVTHHVKFYNFCAECRCGAFFDRDYARKRTLYQKWGD